MDTLALHQGSLWSYLRNAMQRTTISTSPPTVRAYMQRSSIGRATPSDGVCYGFDSHHCDQVQHVRLGGELQERSDVVGSCKSRTQTCCTPATCGRTWIVSALKSTKRWFESNTPHHITFGLVSKELGVTCARTCLGECTGGCESRHMRTELTPHIFVSEVRCYLDAYTPIKPLVTGSSPVGRTVRP